uniref:Uncharacterized protein n=2 Tax=Astyanax mexicanus TaxID=7994 RepID=A0A3B1JYD6_ASTMX
MHTQFLVVQHAVDRDDASLGVNLKHLLGEVGHKVNEGVHNLTVRSLIRVCGVQVDDEGVHWGVLHHVHSVHRLVEHRVVVVGVQHLDIELHCASLGWVASILGCNLEGVVRLTFSVQHFLHDKLGNLGPITPSLDLQSEDVVGGDGVGLDAIASCIWVAGTLQRVACARCSILRDLQVNSRGGKARCIVIHVNDLNLDHADLHGV